MEAYETQIRQIDAETNKTDTRTSFSTDRPGYDTAPPAAAGSGRNDRAPHRELLLFLVGVRRRRAQRVGIVKRREARRERCGRPDVRQEEVDPSSDEDADGVHRDVDERRREGDPEARVDVADEARQRGDDAECEGDDRAEVEPAGVPVARAPRDEEVWERESALAEDVVLGVAVRGEQAGRSAVGDSSEA